MRENIDRERSAGRLVTLVLLAYNQEDFIEDAINGAFSQTYSPLQIVLSDDNSSDKTFNLMERLKTSYQGVHDVILNRNAVNLGMGSHINKAMTLADGDLIVVAAGDDVSVASRVEEIVSNWIVTDCVADSLHSSEVTMALDGTLLTERSPKKPLAKAPEEVFYSRNAVLGATQAWTKRLFDTFGPLNSDLVLEDRAIRFRASLLGGAKYIDIPLVYHRVGGISNSNASLQKIFFRQYSLYEQYLTDLNKLPLKNASLSMTIRCKSDVMRTAVSILSSSSDKAALSSSFKGLMLYVKAVAEIIKYWVVLKFRRFRAR